MGDRDVNYRAVHAKTLWRKAKGHKSMESALLGPKNGAPGLFAGKARIDYVQHGAPLYVVIWKDGAELGYVMKKDVTVPSGISMRSVPVEHVLRFEERGRADIAELEAYFVADIVGDLPELGRIEPPGAVPAIEFSAKAVEGEWRLVAHLEQERNTALSTAKKKAVLSATGRLRCEACSFDFLELYGALGDGFCEVHHVRPLSERAAGLETSLEDLAVLCSNCHSIIHRTHPIWTVSSLGAHIARVRGASVG